LRLGFVEEGHLRKHILKNDRYVDVIQYGLFADEWRNRCREAVEAIIDRYGIIVDFRFNRI
jgi:hypothetical protein